MATIPKPAMPPTTVPAMAPPESTGPPGVSFCPEDGVADAMVDDVLEARPLELVTLLDAAREGLLAKVEVEDRIATEDLCECNEVLEEQADGRASRSRTTYGFHTQNRGTGCIETVQQHRCSTP
jgi:hypothetical protein